jgi:hypothetical protein
LTTVRLLTLKTKTTNFGITQFLCPFFHGKPRKRVSAFHADAIFAKPLADGVPLQYPTRLSGSISLLSPLRFFVAEPSRRPANPSHILTGVTPSRKGRMFAQYLLYSIPVPRISGVTVAVEDLLICPKA